MEGRLVEFVRGLRAAGVRVSVAEALDALRAAQATGVSERSALKAGFRATLIKAAGDFEAFEALFPMYFGTAGPPLENALEDLSEDDRELVAAALEALTGRLRRLLDWLTSGEGPSAEELERLARQAGTARARRPGDAKWITQRMLRQLGFRDLEGLLAELEEQLREAGVSPEATSQLLGIVDANREALEERIAREVGMAIRKSRAETPREDGSGDLMHADFRHLEPRELDRLRHEVTRLAARLRSRAALRYRRAGRGRIDPKRTLRANQRYGGVPMELRLRRRKRKPRLVMICDVSTSMRPVSEFLLHMLYELADQVGHARSFVFNDDLTEVSALMTGRDPAAAIDNVLRQNPGGHYATDLGRSLGTFVETAPSSVDRRTTLILVGDGRNNFRPPGDDLLRFLRRRARRVLWLNPEPSRSWGTGDSDMLLYAPHCDEVLQVANMAQLSAAIDRLLVAGNTRA